MRNKQNQKSPIDDVQALLLQSKILVPSLSCPGGHPIAEVCINQNCKARNALYCKTKYCQFCPDTHNCKEFSLAELVSLMNHPFQESRQLMEELRQIEEDFIKRIRNDRISLVQEYLWAGLPSQFQPIVEMFRTNNPQTEIKPHQASALVQRLAQLREGRKEKEGRVQELTKKFQSETTRIAISLKKFQSELIEEVQDKQNDLLSSHIISNTDERSIRFIMNTLQKPRKLKLLFRASEHSFSAIRFHRQCDNIPNTLTLIKTGPGKVIGGFTPLIWESPQDWKCLPDHSKRSFLLSVDLHEKMMLVNPKKAIQCDKKWGPIFGGENADIAIADNCFAMSDSSISFPCSYNLHGKYQRNQKTYEALSGQDSGFFKVKQYEVFKVHY